MAAEATTRIRGVGTGDSPAAGPPLLSIAPMMDWTDVHYRQLARLISKHTWLWTEMVVDTTVVHAQDLRRFLWFPPEQHPIVLQLGGSDPEQLGRAAKIAGTFRYDEINLNCGCPSDRVAGAGCFGASLMLQPGLVADCMAAVAANVSAPTTVKCRLGVDDVDSYPDLCNFIHTVSQGSPVRHFIVHSRKCHLKGLNPHQNRTIPPLRYEWVFALKRDFPHLNFSLNGGIQSCYDARSALQHSVDGCQLHGVMIGRAAYHRPWQCLGEADTVVFGGDRNAATCRRQVLEAYAQYADAMVGSWEVKPDGWRNPSVRTMTVPLLNLFHGERGSKKWKQALDSRFRTATSVSQLLHDTLHLLPDAVLDAPPGPPTDNAAFATAPSLPPAPASLQLLRVHPAAAERVEESLRVKRRKEEEKMERRAARRQQVEKNAPGTASQNGTPATGASAPTAVTACNGGTTPSASPPSPSFPAASPLGMNPDPACPLGIAEPVAAGGGVIL